MPNHLTLEKIDESTILKHSDLSRHDECYYWRKYTVGEGYKASETNGLLFNFKINPNEKRRLKYKNEAIQTIADEMIEIVGHRIFQEYTFVPIPPSKIKNDVDYDDRLIRVLETIGKKLNIDIQIAEMIFQKKAITPVHLSEKRLAMEEWLKLYEFNNQAMKKEPKKIVIFDDILTKGSHFSAAKMILASKYPKTPIVGLFIARSVNSEYFLF